MERRCRIAVSSLSVFVVFTLSAAASAAPLAQAPLSQRRANHVAGWFPGVGVVVTGGHTPDGGPEAVECFDPASGLWSPRNPAPVGLWDAATVDLADGRWLALDGLVGLVYDPGTDAWTELPALAESYRENTSLSLLADGDVLIVGGLETPKTSLRLDPVTGALDGPRDLIQPRNSHSATTLADGRVLVAGGWRWGYLPAWDSEIHEPLAAAELYDPATDTWSAAASMTTPRDRHGAALLPSGEVLVIGGSSIEFSDEVDPFRITATAERYDPASNGWTPAASMSAARFDHTTTRLPSGRVLVTGGRGDGGVLASVEVYDPASDSWTSLPPMSLPRWLHTATVVPGRGVLIVGGAGSSITTATAEVELYPLGQTAAGGACVIADECASGDCLAGTCAAESDDSGDPGAGEWFECEADQAASWPDGAKALGLVGFGCIAVRRRRRPG